MSCRLGQLHRHLHKFSDIIKVISCAILPALPQSHLFCLVLAFEASWPQSTDHPSLSNRFATQNSNPIFVGKICKKNALRAMPKVVWSPSKHLFPRLRWRPGGCPGSRNVKSTRTRFHNFLQNLPLESPPPVVNIAEAHGLARPVKKGHASNVTNVLTIEYQRCDEKGRGLPS